MGKDLIPLSAELTESEIRQLHLEYLNSGLTKLLGLLGFDRVFERADGCVIWDREGNEYLDFLGGYGALNLGHNPAVIFQVLRETEVVPKILHVSLGKYPAILAHNLACVAPGQLQRTFFSNSGAEAVECALKMARAATGKTVILSIEDSFHGKTMGALSLTGKPHYQDPFRPMVPDCEILPSLEPTALEQRLRRGDVAALIVEPILGEGGVKLHSKGWLKTAEELCHRYRTLFIVDEIQTGLGRTGRLFASEHEGLCPDIMCLAKSLSGGYIPIGATIATDQVWQKAFGGLEKCLRHTSTFGGNAWACVAGIAVLDYLVRNNICQSVATKGERLLQQLTQIQKEYAFIKEVRGQGLLIGVEFDTKGLVGRAAYEYVGSMIAGELLNRHRIITAYTLNNPAVVRIEPPLVVADEQIRRFLEAFRDVVSRSRSMSRLLLSSAGTMLRARRKGA